MFTYVYDAFSATAAFRSMHEETRNLHLINCRMVEPLCLHLRIFSSHVTLPSQCSATHYGQFAKLTTTANNNSQIFECNRLLAAYIRTNGRYSHFIFIFHRIFRRSSRTIALLLVLPQIPLMWDRQTTPVFNNNYNNNIFDETNRKKRGNKLFLFSRLWMFTLYMLFRCCVGNNDRVVIIQYLWFCGSSHQIQFGETFTTHTDDEEEEEERKTSQNDRSMAMRAIASYTIRY